MLRGTPSWLIIPFPADFSVQGTGLERHETEDFITHSGCRETTFFGTGPEPHFRRATWRGPDDPCHTRTWRLAYERGFLITENPNLFRRLPFSSIGDLTQLLRVLDRHGDSPPVRLSLALWNPNKTKGAVKCQVRCKCLPPLHRPPPVKAPAIVPALVAVFPYSAFSFLPLSVF